MKGGICMYFPVTTFDSSGARQLPIEKKKTIYTFDIYGQPVHSGDNIIEFENGDVIQIGDFREYVENLPDSELIEFMGGKNKEVKA